MASRNPARRSRPPVQCRHGTGAARQRAVGVLRSALAYYRQNATPPLLLGLRENDATVIASTTVPTLVVHGAEDRCLDRRLFEHAVVEDDFPGGVRREMMPGAAHFLHLEQPDEVHRLVLDWLNG